MSCPSKNSIDFLVQVLGGIFDLTISDKSQPQSITNKNSRSGEASHEKNQLNDVASREPLFSEIYFDNSKAKKTLIFF